LPRTRQGTVMRNRPHRPAKRLARESYTSDTIPNAPNAIIAVLKPVLPAALDDGLVPIAALDPHLVVHAPIDPAVDAFIRPDDLFEVVIDGLAVKGTGVAYLHPQDKASFITFRIPKAFIDLLTDGIHALSYRITIMPTRETLESASVPLHLHRTPAGGLCWMTPAQWIFTIV
jgi:hypothetical protein